MFLISSVEPAPPGAASDDVDEHVAQPIAPAASGRGLDLASCWGALEQRLAHKTQASNGSSVLVKVDPRNTSRTCTTCGHTAANNRESQAVFACQACGHQDHADTNAAINIRERGLAMVELGAAPLCLVVQPTGYPGGQPANGRRSLRASEAASTTQPLRSSGTGNPRP